MHDRVKAGAAIEILLARPVVGKEPGDVAAAIERRGTPRPEIGIDLAGLEHVAQRLLRTDEFEPQLADRAQVHVVVRRARLVHAAFDPTDAVKIDAVLVLENAANPDAGGLPVFLDPHPLAFEIARRGYARILVDEDEAVPKQARRKDRKRDKGKRSARSHDRVMRERHLGDIERLGLDHPREDFRRRLYGEIAKVYSLRLHHALRERFHPIVRTARHRQLQTPSHSPVLQFRLCC